jgi:hypothetical protein
MNIDLLENSIKYHGKPLFNLISGRRADESTAKLVFYSQDDNQVKRLGEEAKNPLFKG